MISNAIIFQSTQARYIVLYTVHKLAFPWRFLPSRRSLIARGMVRLPCRQKTQYNYHATKKNISRASTGFEPMASVLALQCSTN